jgi:hypothetical protein
MEETPKVETYLELYKNYLSQEGYKPEIDDDGDLRFKREGRTFYIFIDKKDKDFFRLVLPGFWSFNKDTELLKVLEACDYANFLTKSAKVYTTKDIVSSCIEMFLPSPQSFAPNFERMCRAVVQASNNFKGKFEGREQK